MNRLEMCSVTFYDSETRCHRNCRTDEQMYVLSKLITAQDRKQDNDKPLEIWVSWQGWADDYTTEVVTDAKEKNPDLKYQHYMNYGVVEDDAWTREQCWAVQYAEKNDDPIVVGGEGAYAISSYDEFTGNATMIKNGNLVMLESRGDGIRTPEDIKAGAGLTNYTTAKNNFGHQPSHAYLEAYFVAERNMTK